MSHSFPPFNQEQSDSEVTLSNFSSEKSADFLFPDPPSPPIQSLPKHTQLQTPPFTTVTSEPIATGPLPSNPVLEQIIPDPPTSQPPTSQPPTSQPPTSETPTSEPITSATSISLYGSPIITLPSESTDLILYNP